LIRELSPQELVEAVSFWKNEELLAEKAKEVIKKFERLIPPPYDYFKVSP